MALEKSKPRRNEDRAPGATQTAPEPPGAARPAGLRTFFAESGTPVPGTTRPPVTPTQRRVLVLTWIAMFFMLAYVASMGLAFVQPGYSLADRIASVFLLLGIGYITLHSVGYANSMIKAAWGYSELRRRAFTPQHAPRVACVIATFNEPAAVVEETVAALVNMDYPNKEIVILDDSTREEARRAMQEIATRFGVAIRQRTNRRGYKAGAINEFLPTTDAPYVAIFDADNVPAHNFLRDIVPIIAENPKLAFVQTPQHYANVDVSAVALGAARQQDVFYEYIAEGKSYSRAAFCCGTNFIARRAALLDVGGFDSSTVTEDFATSVILHAKGYDSLYYNQIYVYGMGPETLAAYFTQQRRWAFGSVKTGWIVLRAALSGKLRLGQFWEYSLSALYYWNGWVNFLFMLLPLLYIFFQIKPLRLDVFTYLMIFVPYMLFSMNMFYAGMEQRGYRFSDIVLGQQISFLCFPVHMAGALSGFFGLKRPFGVTPKGVGDRMSWFSLWPQLLMLALSLAAFGWGIYRYAAGFDRNTAAIVINSIWALYHVFLLSAIFGLNRSVHQVERERYFATAPHAVPLTTTPDGVTASDTALPRARIIVPPPIGVRHRTRPARIGRGALVLSLGTIALVVSIGLTMAHWYTAAPVPVNVYIVDRTTGRDYQEHRTLTWTLNFLKVRKQEDFGPSQEKRSAYDYAEDFYGFVPGDPATATDDPLHPGDLLVTGGEQEVEGRPRYLLPPELKTPGVLYLADTYGEFVEYDYRRGQYVRNRPDSFSGRRGLWPEEIKEIEDFYRRQGLVIAEWNTLGYPTLPGLTVGEKDVPTGLANVPKGLAFLRDQELAQRQSQLRQARAVGNIQWQKTMEEQIIQTRQTIDRIQQNLKDLRKQQAKRASYRAQLAAQ
ncbi:MAG: cellulose synthase catalytic subunit, partial [Armatimonadota bacterium]|nr:cellulose synthase catalytic subunit [Armatimonadota bacterium]